MKLLTNPIVIIVLAVLLSAGGFVGAMFMVKSPASSEEKKTAHEEAHNVHGVPNPEKIHEELERLRIFANELDRQKSDMWKTAKSIDEREGKLKKTEDDLRLEREALVSMKKEIETMRKQLDDRFVLVKSAQEKQQEANMQHLVKLYNNMTLDSVSTILAALPEDQTVKLLKRMKEDRTAKILEEWTKKGDESAERAKRILALLRVSVQPEEQTP
jgi:flagellar motility protein MotE (MotC chaperone)